MNLLTEFLHDGWGEMTERPLSPLRTRYTYNVPHVRPTWRRFCTKFYRRTLLQISITGEHFYKFHHYNMYFNVRTIQNLSIVRKQYWPWILFSIGNKLHKWPWTTKRNIVLLLTIQKIVIILNCPATTRSIYCLIENRYLPVVKQPRGYIF